MGFTRDELETVTVYSPENNEYTIQTNRRTEITKLRRMAKEDKAIRIEDEGDQVTAHFPCGEYRFPMPRKMVKHEMTEEQKQVLRDRLANYRKTIE